MAADEPVNDTGKDSGPGTTPAGTKRKGSAASPRKGSRTTPGGQGSGGARAGGPTSAGTSAKPPSSRAATADPWPRNRGDQHPEDPFTSAPRVWPD